MLAHILVRYRRSFGLPDEEVISVHFKKKDALEIAEKKNGIHEARSPYSYRVISKAIK
ncbi:hypothetical protein L8Q47_15085 [Enterobacter bugandensis]|uniref:hypothetical protein n=1 Tax=Enterobacter bugandensis TaxID=881260 RepID=UPI0020064547|nr:hypothetical protein [Enterobacter bugandensis]MCK6946327.1 hypothetical protein [Enterobacter bugandensis]